MEKIFKQTAITTKTFVMPDLELIKLEMAKGLSAARFLAIMSAVTEMSETEINKDFIINALNNLTQKQYGQQHIDALVTSFYILQDIQFSTYTNLQSDTTSDNTQDIHNENN